MLYHTSSISPSQKKEYKNGKLNDAQLWIKSVVPPPKSVTPLLEFQHVTKVRLPEIKPIWGCEFRIPSRTQPNLREKLYHPIYHVTHDQWL